VQRLAAGGLVVLGLAIVVAACGSTAAKKTSQTSNWQAAPTIQKAADGTYFAAVADQNAQDVMEATSMQAAVGEQLKQLGAPSGSVQIVEFVVGEGASPQPYPLVGMKTGQVMRLNPTLTLVAVPVP